MNKEELEKIVDLIEDYDICIKEAEYEGNVEQKEGLVETKILLEKAINYISKLQEENTKLKSFNSYLSNSDIDYLEGENIRLQKENEELRNFIQNNGILYRRRDN